MLFWRRRHCCHLCLKRNSKCFVVQTTVMGFVSLVLLVCVFLMFNNHSWVLSSMVSGGHPSAGTVNHYHSKNSLPMIWALWKMIKRTMPMAQTEPELEHLSDAFQDSQRNPIVYNYIINEPEKCKGINPFLVLLVAVSPGQSYARQAIRKTWGNETLLPGLQIVRLFLLGRDTHKNGDAEHSIKEESKHHHDIIQQSYIDNYYNLTLKTLMGMNWVATYCPHVSYVMKTDSDMFVNTEYLIKKLLMPDVPPKTNYFTGYLMRGYSPNRNKDSKWYMPPDLYPEDMYPIFCSGTGYVFSGDLAEKIFKTSLSIKRLHLEDVYVGICLANLHIDPVPPPNDSDFNHWRVSYSDCKYNQIITSHEFQPDELLKYWNQLQNNKHFCAKLAK
ncbi:beta-1,3-galactosyltransferase 2 [Bombina bombina]|uniref:beta-1,3-galactosyltransferase 2 n=1 Tax=Bombina bombina TaxID=8345 RepID=UPI00235A802B|nr:beta-1,3-galactosyltransferase 2 [Bombina bombina]XP_053549821.1 beta-1,3-galactosyltransferase 2 [Bombina bombina]XP_053549822.1 beta-1,3-galactosyltransferase 2 [Bombina bombina]